MLEYIRIHHIENVYHVDASIRFKNAKSHSKFDWLLSGVLDTVILVLRFWNAVKRYKPKCVHVTSSASLALYKDEIYLLIASFLKVNVILHYRFGRIPELAKQKDWEWKKLLSCVRRAKHAIVIDSMSYEVLCKEGFKEKVSYIPNPCSPLVEAIAKQAVQKKQQNKFIFVGHVIPTKGVYELVEAFTQLKEDVVLETNTMFTLEPGLYFDDEAIGIRIEDTILVTKDGPEILSEGIPKKIEDIERFMAKGE